MNKKAMSQRKIDGYLKLAEIINYGRKFPVRFVERFFGLDLLDFQKYVFLKSWYTPNCVWCMGRSSGKALSLDTKIPTLTGFKTMGELQIGDYILTENGEPTKVTYVSDIFIGHKCYEVEFDDGAKIIADAEHLWALSTKKNEKIRIFTTENIAKDYVRHRNDKVKNEYKYRIQKNNPIKYQEKELPIHPYLLGIWLGDGNSANTNITCGYEDLNNMITNINEIGYSTKIYYHKNRTPSIGVGITPRGQENKFKTELRNLNLINNKHIPEIYLYSNIEQRYELLKGLMDSDGTCSIKGECSFSQKDYNIIIKVSQLLSSLGITNIIKNKKSKCKGKEYYSYNIFFRVDKNHSCFKLLRKHERLQNELHKRQKRNSIISVKEILSVPTKCITVDNHSQLYLCSEKFVVTHNTTLGSPFLMAKSLLIPNFQAYILAGSGSQSQEMFSKIEKIAKREIASFTGLTDIFLNETVKSASNKDGFTHNPSSFEYNLYNGSAVNSLNGAINNLRSRRSNCNFYDESGFAPDELFTASLPFITQNSSFRLGGDVDVSTFPKQFPNQAIFASSASSTDTFFFRIYREYAQKMMLGDSNYFVADINSDVVINATYNGKLYPVPLLSQQTIDNAMRENYSKGMREYKNIFTTEGSDKQIIKRSVLIRNSELRIPIFANNSNRKFALAYDPSRSYDNAITMVGEIIFDENIGYKMEICNGVSFVDIAKKKKTPMRTPEQIEYLKKMILDYNGKQSAEYENIETVCIDAGAGGGGVNIADYLMEDWTDNAGIKHKGLIDKIESTDYVSKFPNAVDKIKLLSPQKYKKMLFDALIEMLNLDLISFTEDYDMKGFLTFADSENSYKLSFDEELALKNIDLAKEELVNMNRYDGTNGNYRYDLRDDRVGRLYDDRAYCLAMLAWYLSELRRKHITGKKKNTNISPSSYFAIANKSSRARR